MSSGLATCEAAACESAFLLPSRPTTVLVALRIDGGMGIATVIERV
jgi:hypothetical protein